LQADVCTRTHERRATQRSILKHVVFQQSGCRGRDCRQTGEEERRGRGSREKQRKRRTDVRKEGKVHNYRVAGLDATFRQRSTTTWSTHVRNLTLICNLSRRGVSGGRRSLVMPEWGAGCCALTTQGLL